MVEKLRIRFSQVFVVALILFISLSASAWETRAPMVSPLLFLSGAVLVGIASLGRLWCSLYIAGYKTDKLIMVGPYSMCRNPLYFFSFLGAAGVGLATETLTLPLIIVLAFAAYYPLVIKSEEAELQSLHKDEFEHYFESVPSFFPRLSRLIEPDEYIVKPIVFKQHIFSALWFVWLLGVMELIESLHEIKLLPTIFHLY